MKKNENAEGIKKYVYFIFFVLLVLAEIFVAINYSEQFLWIVGIGVCILVDNYLLINAFMKEIKAEKEKQTKQLQNIDNSKKALYILFKRNFMELDKRMSEVEKLVLPITNELEASQKKMECAIVQSMEDNRKVAKLIIGRNKENAETLMNYNGEFAEKMRMFEEKLEQIETKFSSMGEGAFVVKQDIESELKQDVAREIISGNPTIEEEAVEEVAEEPLMEEVVDPNKPMSPEDIAALLESIGGGTEESPVEEVVEEVVEEPLMEEVVDPNKSMDSEDILALLESLSSDIEDTEEELGFEAMEETEIPDFSDLNKIMSPEDIAALIAHM